MLLSPCNTIQGFACPLSCQKSCYAVIFTLTGLYSSQWWLPQLSLTQLRARATPILQCRRMGGRKGRMGGRKECIAPWSDASLRPMLNGTFSSTNLSVSMNQTLSHLRVDHASVHAQPAAFVRSGRAYGMWLGALLERPSTTTCRQPHAAQAPL